MSDPTPSNKYTVQSYEPKRVRYYNGQFLKDDDFITEQRYHVSQQRRHERLLHFAGIAEGLVVSVADSGRTVKVSQGSAVDSQGRTIMLTADQSLPVDSTWGGTMYVEISYAENESDPADQNSSVQANTRFAAASSPAAIVRSRTPGSILLAELALASGAVTTVKTDGRIYAGVALPGLTGGSGDGALRTLGDASPGWAQLGAGLSVRGDAALSGKVFLGSAGLSGPQKLTLGDNGGIGFAGAGLNANDKRLWSPADGLLRWQTNVSAATHAFEVGHQTDAAAVHLDISGNSWLNGGNVAIGTNDPIGYKLRVNGNVYADGAITPSAGNAATNGIMFPQNPGGGSGDMAFIRYFVKSAETMKLLVGIDNDPDDSLGLWQMGAERLTIFNGKVGINTAGAEPGDALEVKGGARILTDSNPIRFTSGWSNFTAGGANQAEISNDTGTYKALMLVGNTSGGVRRVGVWDQLDVNGVLNVTGDLNVPNGTIKGKLVNNGALTVTNGAIIPAVSKSATDGAAGIMFPTDPGGGGGDSAFIRYFVKAGETTKLLVGIENDPDDSLGLWQMGGERLTIYSGKVGINTGGAEPADALEVKGAVRILTDGNPIRFTSSWSDFARANTAEISNDISNYKTLMIVGNTSAGTVRRVGIWDRLDVNGELYVNGGFVPAYISDWVNSNAGDSAPITFNVGFFPLLVKVIVQVRTAAGSWAQGLYSHVPPARQTWDDVDRRGETVYTFNGSQVIVYPAATSVARDIFDGADGTRRFKVFAWRSVGGP